MTTTSPIEKRKQWIAALRSGQYVQGQSRLHGADDSFCCLGVLCDLSPEFGTFYRIDDILVTPAIKMQLNNAALKDLYLVSPDARRAFAFVSEETNSEYIGWPPMVLAKEVGLASEEFGILAALNDDGRSFEEIASVLENIDQLRTNGVLRAGTVREFLDHKQSNLDNITV